MSGHYEHTSFDKHRQEEVNPSCDLCQKYYRIPVLAGMFDVSEKTIRRMITDRRIRANRIAGCIRIPHSELSKIVQDY